MAQWLHPFPANGATVNLLGGRLELHFIQPPLPPGISTGGRDSGPAGSLVTTQGLWEPLALASDFSGEEMIPKSLTPRYSPPHRLGTFSTFSSPVLFGDHARRGRGNAVPTLGPGH